MPEEEAAARALAPRSLGGSRLHEAGTARWSTDTTRAGASGVHAWPREGTHPMSSLLAALGTALTGVASVLALGLDIARTRRENQDRTAQHRSPNGRR